MERNFMALKKDKKWLLKNGDHIIGPFTEKEIKKELKKKYLSPFVSASVPGQEFWGFLAGYEEFKKEYAEYTGISSVGQFIKTLNAGSLVIEENPVAENLQEESSPTSLSEESSSSQKSPTEESPVVKNSQEESSSSQKNSLKPKLEKLSPLKHIKSKVKRDHVLVVISVLLILISIVILI